MKSAQNLSPQKISLLPVWPWPPDTPPAWRQQSLANAAARIYKCVKWTYLCDYFLIYDQNAKGLCIWMQYITSRSNNMHPHCVFFHCLWRIHRKSMFFIFYWRDLSMRRIKVLGTVNSIFRETFCYQREELLLYVCNHFIEIRFRLPRASIQSNPRTVVWLKHVLCCVCDELAPPVAFWPI